MKTYFTKSLALTIHIFLLAINCISGQGRQEDDHYKALEEKYRRLRDSLSLLHPFIPAISSVMIRKDQVEVNLFNSIMTADHYRDAGENLRELTGRQTYFYSTLQMTYGVSGKSKFNLGLDVNSIVGRFDQDRNSSMFRVFKSGTAGNSLQAGAVTSVAARFRWRPLKKSYNFTVQSSVGLPFSISREKQPVLGRSQYYLLIQLLYNQPLSKRFFLFTQYSAQYNFKRDDSAPVLFSPLTAYLSWLTSRKVILFGLLNYIPIFVTEGNQSYRYTLQPGGGVQYLISRSLLVNVYFTNDIKGKNYQDFSSYNISIRYVTH